MKIHILRQPATEVDIRDMLEELGTYIKLAVDVERNILAGGGEYHADCEEALLEDGSQQEDVWGADWYPDSRVVAFSALILLGCAGQASPSLARAYLFWLLIMSVSTVLVHQHHIFDVVSGLVLALVTRRISPLGSS